MISLSKEEEEKLMEFAKIIKIPKYDLVHFCIFLFGFYCWDYEIQTTFLLFSCFF